MSDQARALLFMAVVFGGPIVFGVWRIRRHGHDKRALLDLSFVVFALSGAGSLGEFFALAKRADLPLLYEVGPSLRSALLLSACVLCFLPRGRTTPEEAAATREGAEVEAPSAKGAAPPGAPPLVVAPVADLEIEVASAEADETAECPYCRSELRVGAADATQCQVCAAWAHSECWQENRDQCPACVYAS